MALEDEAGGEEKTATTRKRDRRRTLQVGLAGLLTLAVVLFIFGGSSPPLQRLSALVFDLYQNIKPRVESGAPIVVVDIDEAIDPRARAMALAAIRDRADRRPAARARRRRRSPSTLCSPIRTAPRSATAAEALVRAGASVELPPNVLDNDEDPRRLVRPGRRDRRLRPHQRDGRRPAAGQRPASPSPAPTRSPSC